MMKMMQPSSSIRIYATLFIGACWLSTATAAIQSRVGLRSPPDCPTTAHRRLLRQVGLIPNSYHCERRRRLNQYKQMHEIAKGGFATVYIARKHREIELDDTARINDTNKIVKVTKLYPKYKSAKIELLNPSSNDENEMKVMCIALSDIHPLDYYAIKTIRQREDVQRELRAAKIQKQFSTSPYINRVLKVDEGNGGRIIMDLAYKSDTFDDIKEKGTFLHKLVKKWDKSNYRDHENKIKFYVACLVRGIETIHKQNIAHRDLKLDNLLIDAKNGYLQIADFGLAVKSKTMDIHEGNRIRGTLGYMSPEQGTYYSKYGKECDWWSFGVIMFLLLSKANRYPEPDIVRQSSLFMMPSRDAQDLVCRLLNPKLQERFKTVEQVKNHAWFKDFKWEELDTGKYAVPWIPAPQTKYTYIKDEASNIAFRELENKKILWDVRKDRSFRINPELTTFKVGTFVRFAEASHIKNPQNDDGLEIVKVEDTNKPNEKRTDENIKVTLRGIAGTISKNKLIPLTLFLHIKKLKWNTSEVFEWAQRNENIDTRTANKFKSKSVTGKMLLTADRAQLKKWGVKNKNKVLKEIAKLKEC